MVIKVQKTTSTKIEKEKATKVILTNLSILICVFYDFLSNLMSSISYMIRYLYFKFIFITYNKNIKRLGKLIVMILIFIQYIE